MFGALALSKVSHLCPKFPIPGSPLGHLAVLLASRSIIERRSFLCPLLAFLICFSFCSFFSLFICMGLYQLGSWATINRFDCAQAGSALRIAQQTVSPRMEGAGLYAWTPNLRTRFQAPTRLLWCKVRACVRACVCVCAWDALARSLISRAVNAGPIIMPLLGLSSPLSLPIHESFLHRAELHRCTASFFPPCSKSPRHPLICFELIVLRS